MKPKVPMKNYPLMHLKDTIRRWVCKTRSDYKEEVSIFIKFSYIKLRPFEL